MEIRTLYRYERESGKTTVSPNKPEGDYTEIFRLIADEGMILTDGEIQTPCIDVDSTEGWVEIERDGVQYSDAIDPVGTGRIYTETDNLIESVETDGE